MVRAATIRRCLVFGVCALGVGALYLAPGLGRSSYPVSQPTLNDEPTVQPTPVIVNASASLTSRRSTPTPRSTKPADPAAPTAPATRAPSRASVPANPRSVRSTRGSTAPEPAGRSDDEPPQAVQKITPSKVTPDQLSLSWSEAKDNVRVIGYHVWLSGFQVASTAETHATVRWFNDDTAQHVVQVKAVDAAGNEAPTSPTLLVSRPDLDSTATPQPTDSPTSQPEPSAAPSASGGSSESTRVAPPSPAATSSGGAG